MRFWNYDTRTIPYGSLEINIVVGKDDYMPTNEEVIPLVNSVFSLPTAKIYNDLNIRLYWRDNIRIFECLTRKPLITKGLFRKSYNNQLSNILYQIAESGHTNGWIVTHGNGLIGTRYGHSLFKVIE